MNTQSILAPIAIGAFVVAGATSVAQFLGIRGGLAFPVHQYADLVLLVAGALLAWMRRDALASELRSGGAKAVVGVAALLAVGTIAAALLMPGAGPRGMHGGPGFGPRAPHGDFRDGPGDFEPRRGGPDGAGPEGRPMGGPGGF